MDLLILARERVGGALGSTSQPDMLAARQMQAMSFVVPIPLVCFRIAFPAMVLFTEGLWLRTGKPAYKALAKRWSKVMMILFAVGVVRTIADDGHAHLDAFVLGVQLALDELLLRVHGRWKVRRHSLLAMSHTYPASAQPRV